jgi:hypothetical protein
MRNLTLTIHFCDISQSFVSATKYENISSNVKSAGEITVPKDCHRILPCLHLFKTNRKKSVLNIIKLSTVRSFKFIIKVGYNF